MRPIAFVTHRSRSGQEHARRLAAAVAARETLEKVAVVDMDPQGSLIEWARARGSSDIEAIATGAARLEAALAKATWRRPYPRRRRHPGRRRPGFVGCNRRRRTRHRPDPAEPVRPESKRGHARGARGRGAESLACLLNLCPPDRNSAQVRDGAETLEEMGGLIAPPIFARTDYPNAARQGQGVTEFNPNGAAAEEMRVLWESIRRRLPQARPNSGSRATQA